LKAMNDVPSGVFMLIEDIDVTGTNVAPRTDEDLEQTTSGKGVTMGGLLNAIDGISSPEKVIMFMTTNHPEHLEPALIRPGRVDWHERIDYPSFQECVDMFYRFFPDEPYCRGEKFAENFESRESPLSQAELQELFMENNNSVDDAISAAYYRRSTSTVVKTNF